mmetsp:Transcript_23451/g.33496  ORF Transcript_23451/g.33496 Transcript_23451/m.33496 type:complete len:304 (-) Transcript_23451:327-1238(-)
MVIMEVDGYNLSRFIYRGGQQVIPRHETFITIDKSIKSIPAGAFANHPNIIEVLCHDEVEKIEQEAFWKCPSLRRVIMPGVEVVEGWAFNECIALTDLECNKLEIIQKGAFIRCRSLRRINLPSARIVVRSAFAECVALADARFGSKLERIEGMTFTRCISLERITIPLKDGIIPNEDTFSGCYSLKHVDLVEGELHETSAALQLEDWRNDISEEVDSISQILPTVPAGGGWDVGDKAVTIRRWIRSVLIKIIHYKAQHQRLLDEDVASSLQLVLPDDIMRNYVLSFLELPSHTFEVEELEGR